MGEAVIFLPIIAAPPALACPANPIYRHIRGQALLESCEAVRAVYDRVSDDRTRMALLSAANGIMDLAKPLIKAERHG